MGKLWWNEEVIFSKSLFTRKKIVWKDVTKVILTQKDFMPIEFVVTFFAKNDNLSVHENDIDINKLFLFINESVNGIKLPELANYNFSLDDEVVLWEKLNG